MSTRVRTHRSRRMAPLAGLACTGLLALAALPGCDRGPGDEAEEVAQEQTIPVAVETLASGEARAVIRTWAAVEPYQEATILAGVSGTVNATHVQLGDKVERGKVLLEIDPTVFAAVADEAEVRVESAELAVNKTTKDLDRNRAMYEDGEIVSETAVEAARVDAVKARAEQAAARTAKARADVQYRDARPFAPFPGYVAVDPPDPGESILAGALLTQIVHIDRLIIRAEVSEQDLARIEVGSEARFTVESLDREFQGTVTAVSPKAKDDSRQFPVRIESENPPGLPLKAGMIARVEIVYDRWDYIPLLPVDAMVEKDGRQGFYVVEDGHAVWRDLRSGGRMGQSIILLDGGKRGDSVVVLGQTRLANGAAVTVEAAP